MSEEPAKPTHKVRNFVETESLNADLGYSHADLSGAMAEQSSLFVHYGVLAAKASKQVDDLKMVLEVTESKVYRMLRDKASEEGTKVTEAQLEKSVSVHPRVIEFKKALNEAKQVEAVAKTAVEGFRHRRDMLVQAGLISREEMKGEVSINRRTAEDERVASSKERILERAKAKRETAEDA
jgi:hypothetical protein